MKQITLPVCMPHVCQLAGYNLYKSTKRAAINVHSCLDVQAFYVQVPHCGNDYTFNT